MNAPLRPIDVLNTLIDANKALEKHKAGTHELEAKYKSAVRNALLLNQGVHFTTKHVVEIDDETVRIF